MSDIADWYLMHFLSLIREKIKTTESEASKPKEKELAMTI